MSTAVKHPSRDLTPAEVDALVAGQRAGFSLERPFYLDRAVYERDIERIFMRAWLYVGHASEIAAAGDYFLFEIADESVIVTRGDDGEIRALLNVCRHRGSRICDHPRGSVRTFVCPYHGWTYDRAGRFRAGRYLPEDFDREAYGLRSIHVENVHGLLFVSFADTPAAIEPAVEALRPALAPFGLDRTRVARRVNYPIDANWKLAVENYDECYHCQPAHREYARIHARDVPHGDREALVAAMNARAADAGLCPMVIDRAGGAAIPGAEQFFFERYPMYEGYLSGSSDGQPVAPLLGDLRGYDGGASDLQVGPVSFGLIYSDHAVLYRFTPRDVVRTDCEITWLVHEDAEPGVDYEVDRLTWLWDVTTVADKTIIDRNQAGVRSRFYEPGPYTPMEAYTRTFVDWYLDAIR